MFGLRRRYTGQTEPAGNKSTESRLWRIAGSLSQIVGGCAPPTHTMPVHTNYLGSICTARLIKCPDSGPFLAQTRQDIVKESYQSILCSQNCRCYVQTGSLGRDHASYPNLQNHTTTSNVRPERGKKMPWGARARRPLICLCRG